MSYEPIISERIRQTQWSITLFRLDLDEKGVDLWIGVGRGFGPFLPYDEESGTKGETLMLLEPRYVFEKGGLRLHTQGRTSYYQAPKTGQGKEGERLFLAETGLTLDDLFDDIRDSVRRWAAGASPDEVAIAPWLKSI